MAVYGGYNLEQLGNDFVEGLERNRERTQPIDRPYGPEMNTRSVVVRVDLVVMALHIIAARLALHDFASAFSEMLQKVQRTVVGIGTRTFVGPIGKSVGAAGGTIAKVGSLVADTLDADLLELRKEVVIRKGGWRARRDVYGMVLSQRKHHVRKTKLVSTRHRTKKQRKANKSWRQP